MGKKYDNTNSGVLFKNKYKEQSKDPEKAPDYMGTVDVDGKQYQLAGWLNTSTKDKSTKFISLRIREHIEQTDGDNYSHQKQCYQKPKSKEDEFYF